MHIWIFDIYRLPFDFWLFISWYFWCCQCRRRSLYDSCLHVVRAALRKTCMICQRSLRNVCIYLCIHSPLTQAHTYSLHMQVAEERSCRGGHFYEVTGDLNVLLSGTSAGCARFNPLLNGLWLWLKSDEENVIVWHLQGLSSLLFVSAHQYRVALWVM